MAKRLLCLGLLVSVFGAPAYAASPSLGGISPRGGQRGTEAVVLFNGARLSDAKEILFYTPGFSVAKLEVVNDNQVKATVKIAADCRLGEHALRLRTATGISELRTFYVGALTQVVENEPNSDFNASQKLPLTVIFTCFIDYDDVDV